MLMERSLSILVLCILLGTWGDGHPQEPKLRVWTDHLSRKVTGEYVRSEGDAVVLCLSSGKIAKVPLEQLSEIDKQWVNAYEARSIAGEASTQARPDPELFAGAWPTRVSVDNDPEITIVKQDEDKKEFIYESAHYSYTSDVKLARSVIKGFAVMFEATFAYCQKLPLQLDGGSQHQGKFPIVLYENKEDFLKAGGIPDSVGTYVGSSGYVLVPFDGLGLKKVGQSYVFDRDKSNRTLPHELTHQLTPHCYFGKGSLGWFTEGIAEYVAVTPYRSGTFHVQQNIRPIIEYVTAYGANNKGGRAMGKEITIPPLEEFMMMDYKDFFSEANKNYSAGLLLVTYFFHMDGEGNAARIKAWLEGQRAGKSGKDSFGVLLGGRTFSQLEDEITKAWSRKGVKFQFHKSTRATH